MIIFIGGLVLMTYALLSNSISRPLAEVASNGSILFVSGIVLVVLGLDKLTGCI